MNAPNGLDDRNDLDALLVRVRAGEEAALAELLRRYEPRLRASAHALLGPQLRSRIDSLDLVQSVHRLLMPGLRDGRYRPDGTDELLSLAMTVVRNKLVSQWRKARREEALPIGFEASGGASPDGDPAPDAERRDEVRRLMATLDESDRALLELRLKGLTPAEMADRLGCDAHRLRARLSRLMDRLRRASPPR